jgi:SNF2 family DNA or RNA helicase
LSLPEADSATVWLTMTPDERACYDQQRKYWSFPYGEMHRLRFEMSQAKLRQACSHYYWTAQGVEQAHARLAALGPSNFTKFKALLDDLAILRASDAHMHAVVFTSSVKCHDALVALLKQKSFVVCGFKGGDNSSKRDEAIRTFQASLKDVSKAKPTVFVVTTKAGSVGVTLTAASRVYMMEPALDPAAEAQAAGRVHRLGQTKDVLVKRFAFKDSLDANIITLHGEIKQGRIKVVDGMLCSKAMDILRKK